MMDSHRLVKIFNHNFYLLLDQRIGLLFKKLLSWVRIISRCVIWIKKVQNIEYHKYIISNCTNVIIDVTIPQYIVLLMQQVAGLHINLSLSICLIHPYRWYMAFSFMFFSFRDSTGCLNNYFITSYVYICLYMYKHS